jgi:hypothetical protein
LGGLCGSIVSIRIRPWSKESHAYVDRFCRHSQDPSDRARTLSQRRRYPPMILPAVSYPAPTSASGAATAAKTTRAGDDHTNDAFAYDQPGCEVRRRVASFLPDYACARRGDRKYIQRSCRPRS